MNRIVLKNKVKEVLRSSTSQVGSHTDNREIDIDDLDDLVDDIVNLLPIHNVSHILNNSNKCIHDNTLSVVHNAIKTNKDYWLFTELLCLLHNDSDVCNCG